MRHGYFGRKLSRTTNERKRLFVNLARELVKRGSIKTTIAKAKAVQPLIEKLITRAKSGNGAARLVEKVLADKKIVTQLMNDAQTRFANRQSGYTRIVKIGTRRGDNSEEAVLMFVDQAIIAEVVSPKKEKKIETEKKEKKPVKKTTKISKRKAVK